MTKYTTGRIGYEVSENCDSMFSVTADYCGQIAEVERWNYSEPDGQEEAEGNARLIVAAWNAFHTASEQLGVNAVEFAERMQRGELAEIFLALHGARQHVATRRIEDALSWAMDE